MITLSLPQHLRRAGLTVAAIVVVALLWCGAAGAATAIAPWSPVTLPSGGAWAAYDAWAFGATSLVVTGDEGHIAVTRNAGRTWADVVPPGMGATAFTAIALDGTGRGAVASGGLLLATSDGGKTWHAPSFTGPAPSAAFNDIALRGSLAVAVGGEGMIYVSDDAGATWRRAQSGTDATLTSVAIAGDGTVVAGSSAGDILIGSGQTWTVAGTAPGPVKAVAAIPDPVWGDAQPDLLAATGAEVLGSDDALAFATLPGLPAPGPQPWSTVAWMGVPAHSLLLAGAGQAGFFQTVDQSWVSGASGASGATRAVAPAGQSVGYVLGADGRLFRTLSAGRDPATVSLGKSRITVGGRTRLTATVSIGAPGTVVVRTRVPGRPWTTLQKVPWTTADWGRQLSIPVGPSLTHDYSLSFRYGGAEIQLADPVQLTVVPKVFTAKARYDLRRGTIFRFSGSVSPRLRGESIELLTDRGGKWRPISLQTAVKLQEGRTWTSRRFGTPKRETYHLRAHLKGTRRHAEAWSRIVTVTIR